MRANRVFLCTLLVTGSIALVHAGDLEPSSPPGATMKTLDVIDGRTPIRPSDLPYTITQSGSYYLTGSASVAASGISVNSGVSGVTIDLNGFTLSGGTGSGIGCGNPTSNIVIRNGTVAGFGSSGISCVAASVVVVENVTARDNDVRGILVGGTSRVVDCTATGNGIDGITIGARSLAARNVASGNGTQSALGGGIALGSAVDRVRVEGNLLSNNDFGLYVSAVGAVDNVIINNHASSNTADYNVQVGNDLGPTGTAASSTSPWANISF